MQYWILHIVGELDLATGPHLSARTDRLLRAGPSHGLVMDVHDVTFIDCAGLGSIIRAHNQLGGDRFRLQRLSPCVRKLLHWTNLEAVLPECDGDAWPGGVGIPIHHHLQRASF